MKTFSNAEHVDHCKEAGCRHPPVHPTGQQSWCARCRARAFGGVYEGLMWADGRITGACGTPSHKDRILKKLGQ